MPTDGTLLLEHMPRSKQYLVTALSVFFSFGAVLSAVVALLVLPQHSCPPSPEVCDVVLQNQGWKYLLIALGLIVRSRSSKAPHAVGHLYIMMILSTTSIPKPCDFPLTLLPTDSLHVSGTHRVLPPT
jgi:MFS family permease